MNWGWSIFVQRQRILTVMAQAIDNDECCKPDSYISFCLRLARHYVNENNNQKTSNLARDSNLTRART